MASPDEAGAPHAATGGGISSILLGRAQPAGRRGPIEMRIPHGGGPPLHRLCAPAGQDGLLIGTGGRVDALTSPAPALSPEDRKARIDHAVAIQARIRSVIAV